MWKLVKFLLDEGGILIFVCCIYGSFVWWFCCDSVWLLRKCGKGKENVEISCVLRLNMLKIWILYLQFGIFVGILFFLFLRKFGGREEVVVITCVLSLESWMYFLFVFANWPNFLIIYFSYLFLYKEWTWGWFVLLFNMKAHIHLIKDIEGWMTSLLTCGDFFTKWLWRKFLIYVLINCCNSFRFLWLLLFGWF